MHHIFIFFQNKKILTQDNDTQHTKLFMYSNVMKISKSL